MIHVVELYRDEYLIGKAFPPDVHSFPSMDELDRAVTWQQIQDHVLEVGEKKAYAAEAYFNLSDTTGKPLTFLQGQFQKIRTVSLEIIYLQS